jgi:hypothetical protein
VQVEGVWGVLNTKKVTAWDLYVVFSLMAINEPLELDMWNFVWWYRHTYTICIKYCSWVNNYKYGNTNACSCVRQFYRQNLYFGNKYFSFKRTMITTIKIIGNIFAIGSNKNLTWPEFNLMTVYIRVQHTTPWAKLNFSVGGKLTSSEYDIKSTRVVQ